MKRFTQKTMLLLILGALFMPGLTSGQKVTNVNALLDFSEKKAVEWQQQRDVAVEYAKQNNIPVSFETDEGTYFELQYVTSEGIPMYYITDNANSAATISTDEVYGGGSAGLNLDGTGIIPREWDAGAVRLSHQEYGGRVVMGDGATTTHYHSTHVAGTIMASGLVPGAKGMAYNASLRAFDWNSDESEMASEAAAGALMSNHSYGYGRGWVWIGYWSWYGNTSISTDEDYLFGFYDTHARDWDQIGYDAPYYLIVKSAGNDRGNGPTNGAYPQDGPYDCISHAGISKNVMTVGAVNDIQGGYTGPSSVVMSSFSSWGPADDGRVKPDIVANGIGLYSTDDDSDTDYASLSGTSMAAPSVTGSLTLLQQHWENLNGSGNYMLAATIKGLVIQTADEAGSNDGPDCEFGWGLMNTANAALLISEDQTLNVIDELSLNEGGTYTRTVHSDGIEPLKVTICWTDTPGTPVSAQLDPINPMLVNDLDLRITFASNTYYPWKLNRDNPANAATNNGENNVDNVEVVYIANPAAGDYLVTVDHDGTLSGSSQAFSIIFSGITDNVIPVPPVADFIADNTNIFEGNNVNFTDLSTGNPTSWSWNFPGGTPATSTDQNPTVDYNTAGTYDVTLIATNDEGSDTETKLNYITVTDGSITYCESMSTNYSSEYISRVDFGSFTKSSAGSYYSDFTGDMIYAEAGLSYGITLTPWKSNPSRKEGWRMWIDYNIDGDFDDDGELVFSANNKRNPVSGTITIPSNASGQTRMRVSMQLSAGPGPCETFTYGEVEDYSIVFALAVPQPPVADFTSDKTTVVVGQDVQFTDLSSNDPTSWSWSFPGGTPASSTVQNPVITYNTLGPYSVTLTATNAEGSDIETKVDYITVTNTAAYCASQGNSNAYEWITQVDIGGFTNASDASGYSDYTSMQINLTPGSSNALTLTPQFVGKARREFWRIWIDFNSDGDFDDADEQVFVANNKKAAVTGTLNIPSNATGQTRLRVTMKYGGSPSACETFAYGEVEDYTVNFNGGTTSTAPADNFDVRIYPNPARDVLNLYIAGHSENITVQIYNSMGSVMESFTMESIDKQIDLSRYSKGIYFIRINDGGKVMLRKFIVR